MGLLQRLARVSGRRQLRLELEKARSWAATLAAERDVYLRQRDQALGERDDFLRQRDDALGERNEILRQRDGALAERDAYLRQRDEALGERNEVLRQRDGALAERDAYLRQRDEALGERNEILRQRDEALGEGNELLRQRDEEHGQKNLLIDRSARYAHRADMIMRPVAGTADRLLLFLHLGKTGGMTLADILARNFVTEEFLQIDLADTGPSANGTWSYTAIERALARLQTSEVARLRAVWGHYGHGVQACLPKPSAVVTLLREPVDRILSTYYYWNGAPWGIQGSLEDYLRRRYCHIGFDNGMCRVLSGQQALDPVVADPDATTENFPPVTGADFEAAAKNLDGYFVVGTTDQFDQTLVVLGSDLRWALSDLVYSPVNATPSRPAPADISDGLREKILAWNSYDAALVERARAHLARRIAAYPGEYDRDLSLFRELNSLYQRGAPAEELRRIERDARVGDATEFRGRRRGSPLHRAAAR